MYAGNSNSADSATIDPAALSSPAVSNSTLRGLKRSRPSDSPTTLQPRDDAISPPQLKRIRPMKPSESPVQPLAAVPAAAGANQAAAPPKTPQSKSTTLPSQTTPATYGPAQTAAAAPPKTTPTKSTIKALPTVRDHTTDQLNPAGDEYLPRETDEFGEKKVMANGQLLGNRTYRCRTFLVPNRSDKLFMLATECARVLGYRDSYLLFNKNRSLFKIIASQAEKDDLVQQEILPFSYRSRQIAIVTARSMFRQFGSRVIENGRRVRDDYWETKARKQGFTEADPAGEKRPGAAKAREAAEAQNSLLMSGPHTEIVYNNAPGPYPGAPPTHLVQQGMMGAPPVNISRTPGLTVGAELGDTRPRDFSGIVKGGPRQEISGPAYQDQTRPSPLGEIHSQAHHAADFNRSVNQQRDMRGDYLHGIWRRPHEQPASSSLNPAVGSADTAAPTTRPSSSPHTTAAGASQQPVVSSHSPQMMMTAPPYSQSIHAQNTLGSTSGGMSQGAPGGYSYQPNQAMWSQSSQAPHHGYGGYTTQSQGHHPSQSPAPHLRQSSTGQIQPNMPFPGMGSMQYGSGQGMYPADQTPRQYLPQGAPGGPQTSQQWSGQHSPPQWWAQPQQPQ
ncbi:hypothetical protein E4U26_007993 [Claviceps purpurea]|nr:hypothetical protein E4U26_007993 [Claviceps purpurea]